MSEKKMTNRIIICGDTQHPLNILEMIFNENNRITYSHHYSASPVQEKYSLISDNSELLNSCSERYPNIVVDSKDASDDEVLIEHGIKTAKAIVVSYNDDRENLLITLSARQLNPTIRIVVTCSMIETMRPKLLRAGATSVISRSNISGLRMASQLIRPNATEFLDLFFQSAENDFSAEEIIITDEDNNNGVTIIDSEYAKNNLLIVAIFRDDEDSILYNPPETYKLIFGDILLVLGARDDFDALSPHTKYHLLRSEIEDLRF